MKIGIDDPEIFRQILAVAFSMLDDLREEISEEYKGHPFGKTDAPPASDVVLYPSDEWTGVYRNIPLSIMNHKKQRGQSVWCGYIELHSGEHLIENVTDIGCRRRGVYNQDAPPFFDDLPWHGGITYYKEWQEGKTFYMKIGHDYDYAHVGVDSSSLNQEILLEDLKKIIDEFWDTIPRHEHD